MLIFRKRRQLKKGKVLFIDASEQIRTGRAQNFLEKEHVNKIFEWYSNFEEVVGNVHIAQLTEIKENDFNLNIPLYVEKVIEEDLPSVKEAFRDLKNAWEDHLKAEAKFKTILNKYI
ncbi:MAG: N-6 DNA methylase [Bacteroidota bacterium]|nr:N-6 DNA methylase [Bacteroidota bacterium]